MNIALVNEMRFLLETLKIDINEIIDLAKTKPLDTLNLDLDQELEDIVFQLILYICPGLLKNMVISQNLLNLHL